MATGAGFLIAECFRRSDQNGSRMDFFKPHLEPGERKTADVEGWILGIP